MNSTQHRPYHNKQTFQSASIQQRPTWADIVQQPSKHIFSPIECYNIFKRFMNDISLCKSKAEQLDTIARLTFEALNNDVCP